MSTLPELQVEVNDKPVGSPMPRIRDGKVELLPPLVHPNYWLLRVRLLGEQAIVVFPKYGTYGIGFAIEDASWNTNLPWGVPADKLYDHIKVNKGNDAIPDWYCIEAIKLLQSKMMMLTGEGKEYMDEMARIEKKAAAKYAAESEREERGDDRTRKE